MNDNNQIPHFNGEYNPIKVVQQTTEGGIAIPQGAHDLIDWERQRNPENDKDTLELGEMLLKRYPDSFKRVSIDGGNYIVSENLPVKGVTYASDGGPRNHPDLNKDPGLAEVRSMVIFTENGMAFNLSISPGDTNSIVTFMDLCRGRSTSDVQGLIKQLRESVYGFTSTYKTKERREKLIQIEPVRFTEEGTSLTSFKRILHKAKEYGRQKRMTRIPSDMFEELIS